MDNLRIGSFNVKDNAINRNGGLNQTGISNADIVATQIKENEFDLLGTQELTIKYVNELMLRLPNYRFYGNYRYGNLLTKIPYNENNNIITNRNVLLEKTLWLPWVPNNFTDLKTSITKFSIMPRIATIVVSEDEEHRKLCMINTHLDYQIPSIQIRQLNALKNIIEKYGKDYPIVLTGDFNMELGDSKLEDFISHFKDTLKHVDIQGKTWHDKSGNEAALDHIFIPKNWKVEDAGIIDSKGTSDHDMIYANIKQK